MRSYELHLSSDEILDDIIDAVALCRNVASAVPDVAFRGRFEHPMPNVFLDAIERANKIHSIAYGRPPLMPGDEG